MQCLLIIFLWLSIASLNWNFIKCKAFYLAVIQWCQYLPIPYSCVSPTSPESKDIISEESKDLILFCFLPCIKTRRASVVQNTHFCRCCNKIPSLNGFYTTGIYFSWFWRLEVHHQSASIVGRGPSSTDFSFCPSVGESVRELHELSFRRAFTLYVKTPPSRPITSQKPHLPTL